MTGYTHMDFQFHDVHNGMLAICVHCTARHIANVFHTTTPNWDSWHEVVHAEGCALIKAAESAKLRTDMG